MFRLAELFVEIGARTGGLNTVLSGVHARLLGMGSIGTALSRGLHKATMGFFALEGAIGKVGIALGVALAGAGVVALGHLAMEAAHLQEAVAKVEQAFGSATPKILGMADELARKFGVVNKEILDTAASFGLMLQGSGITRELSADMSVALSKIAVDAASFFDITMTEAIQRMQSGLSGEMEAVRRWGVNLTETNIKRQAMAAGWSGKGELDQSVKTVIRYKLLMEGLKAAEGDAERSQGRLIGQWKLFTGELYQLATTVGAVAIPIFTGLLHVVNAILGGINSLIGGLVSLGKTVIGTIGGWLGVDVFGAKEEAQRRQEIDARIARTEADRLKDDEAAQANEKKLKEDKDAAKEKKGFQGGLEEFAKHLQEGAWDKKKVDVASQQLDEQKVTNELLKKLGPGMPGQAAGPGMPPPKAAPAAPGAAPAAGGVAAPPNPADAAAVRAARAAAFAAAVGGGPGGLNAGLAAANRIAMPALPADFGAPAAPPPDPTAEEQLKELMNVNETLKKILNRPAPPVVH